jgi:hypothetical protein
MSQIGSYRWRIVALLFNAQYSLELQALSAPLIVLFLIADVGSISGWLSSFWLKQGRTLDFARRNTLLYAQF